MKKSLVLLIVSLIMCTNIFAGYKDDVISNMSFYDNAVDKLLKEGTADNATITNTLNKASNAWDRELNTVYQLLMKKLPEEKKIQLRDEERKWIKEKDEEAKKALDEMEEGAFGPLLKSNVVYEKTKERTLVLAEMYELLE